MIVLHIFVSYIFFALAICLCFYLPGLYLISFARRSFSPSQTHFLAWVVGYSLFILLSYITAWIHIPFLALIIVLVISGYVVLKKRKLLDFSGIKIDKILLFIIVVGSLAFTSMSLLSGLLTSSGLQYVGTVNSSDGLMHIAHIKTEVAIFPPPYAGFAGYSMRGYHYFYDFLLSRFILFFGFGADDLFYRLFPLFISVIYGGCFYLFSSLFTRKRSALIIILAFAYFAQSWGFILSFFTKTVSITNGLGLVQPLELVLDPSAIFAIALMLAGFYVLLERKLTITTAVIAGLVLGVLAELKVYGGIISIITLTFLIVYFFIRKQQMKYYIVAFVVTVFLTVITYLPNNGGVGSLFAKPFFLYETFILQNQLFVPWNWGIRMIIYRAHHNIPHILFMYLCAFILFWVLTLGSRIVVILSWGSLMKKSFWNDAKNICLVIFFIFPLFIGSLFVQSFSIYSTIQFLWIVGLLVAIPAGIFYSKVYEKYGVMGKVIVIIVLLFTNVGAFVANEIYYLFPKYPVVITPQHMQVIHKIQEKVGMHDFFVVAPYYTYDKHHMKMVTFAGEPLFSALTGRVTYYEYETPEYYDQKKIDARKNQMTTITSDLTQCNGKGVRDVMKKIHATYLMTTQDLSCKELPFMQKIIQKDSWIFWQVK